ncbi:hypothetical protein HRbin01_00884 [archaeon HR01]|nr:hypothetical protein HRbin01_00884 [archaeon HR01]
MSGAEYLLYSLAVCFSILIVPGQIFFMLIQEASRSVRDGLTSSLGVVLGEVFLLALLYAGFTLLLQQIIPFLKAGGAVLLLSLAAYSFLKAVKPPRTGSSSGGASLGRGFMLVVMNPPFIIWLLTVGSAVIDSGYRLLGSWGYFIFAQALLISSTTVMLVLIAAVSAGRKVFQTRLTKPLYIVSGGAFILLAINLLLGPTPP